MRKQKGITLIALVVTVIVLLILAGVSITALTDDEKGVVTKAKQAAQETEDATIEEDEDIEELLNYAESEESNTTTNTTTNTTPVTYTVTFSYKDSSGATVTSTATVNYGEDVASSDIPSPVEYTSGSYTYTFSKWVTTSGGSTTATLTSITENKTVYASYTETYSGSVCFVAGTKVLTETGLVNIEDMQVGMKVYSYNEETKEVELKEVLRTSETKAYKDMVKVTVNGDVIESTSKHQYYVLNVGWVYAQDLKIGDILLNSDGKEVIVEEVEFFGNDGTDLKIVYNLEVDGNHNYFVGEENVLVHNAVTHSGIVSIVC